MAGCQGKKAFRDHATAEMARRRKPELRRQVYRCGTCGLLHLGTSIHTHQDASAFARARRLEEIRASEAFSDAWSHA